jgi:hypothetical protein
MRRFILKLTTLLTTFLAVAATAFASDSLLKLPSFDSLEKKSSNVVIITLDEKLLGVATRFLDPNSIEDAAVKQIVSGLHGVYVRNFQFDHDFEYPKSDVEIVRKQLSSPGWQQLVKIRSRKDQTNVDVYLMTDGNKANGLAIISSQPREFTIINIVGSIDLDKLHRLEGKFGIPKMELEQPSKK